MKLVIDEFINQNAEFRELFSEVKSAVTLSEVILASLKLGLAIAREIASEIINQRANAESNRPLCPECSCVLESKGLLGRSITTIIGTIHWKRRSWRCKKGCKIGQITPFDQKLGLQRNQRVSNELKQVACALVIFVPYSIASSLLEMLTGVKVSSGAIWNWVQCVGENAMIQLENELNSFDENLSNPTDLDSKLRKLPLLMGGDGVMVPFRPHIGNAKGKTVWREVKVGIFARLGQYVTRKGKQVSILLHRHLVAVLGNIDEFKARMQVAAVKQGIVSAKVVVWLSDGGRGFWGVYNELFFERAQGILDFYHAAQNLWKAAKKWFDGRTSKARKWFEQARHQLRHGNAATVIGNLNKGLTQNNLPDSSRKAMVNVINYLEAHKEHIKYDRYKELGLPIGSGMVESACKWLIQQRFKCVGMRWSEDGFNYLLHLRLAWVNGTFEQLFADAYCPPKL
jgi:hypothetical protein